MTHFVSSFGKLTIDESWLTSFITSFINYNYVRDLGFYPYSNPSNFYNASTIPSSKSRTIIAGQGTAAVSADAYYNPSGGILKVTSNPSQAVYLPYAGTLGNLAFNFDVNQGSGDTCTLFVQQSTSADGAFANTLLSCTILNVARTCVNTNASQVINSGTYIKMFFDEQAGSCQGVPDWSFVYEN